MAHRILVVEDNPADVYLIRSALEEHSIEASVEVVGGLAPGASVVLYPGDRVADGVRVAARAAEARR